MLLHIWAIIKHENLSTFIENPEGAIFFGQSYSVPCMRIPDSIKMTALSSGLSKMNDTKNSYNVSAIKWDNVISNYIM